MTTLDLPEGIAMEPTEPSDPTDQFLVDVAEIRLRGAGRDTALLRLGAVMMPAGIVLGVVAWFLSHNTDSPLEQRDAAIVALIGVSVAVVGVGLFVRYSFAEFLRFWMARLIHQQEVAARGSGRTPDGRGTETE
jgi:hypothetical protein